MRSLRLALVLLCAAVASAFVLAPSSAFAQPVNCCLLPENGGGTADLPPNCPIGYNGLGVIDQGFPAGSSLLVVARLHSFTGVVAAPGGLLSGETQQWQGTLDLTLTGTGIFSSYARFLQLPVIGETHSAPRVPFAAVQSFNTLLFTMQGQLLGDVDFDLFRVTAGNGFGMPSPGQTTLTTSSGAWLVDSYLDITYRVDLIGRSPGTFGGYSGSSTNVLEHFTMCHEEATPTTRSTWGAMKVRYR